MSRGDKPFKVPAKVGANAYKLDLLGDMTISVTFLCGFKYICGRLYQFCGFEGKSS